VGLILVFGMMIQWFLEDLRMRLKNMGVLCFMSDSQFIVQAHNSLTSEIILQMIVIEKGINNKAISSDNDALTKVVHLAITATMTKVYLMTCLPQEK
jgi:hypothetical protein